MLLKGKFKGEGGSWFENSYFKTRKRMLAFKVKHFGAYHKQYPLYTKRELNRCSWCKQKDYMPFYAENGREYFHSDVQTDLPICGECEFDRISDASGW